jgi:hypothetical protein
MYENLFIISYFLMIFEIKYPEITKKISTPIKPPGKILGNA